MVRADKTPPISAEKGFPFGPINFGLMILSTVEKAGHEELSSLYLGTTRLQGGDYPAMVTITAIARTCIIALAQAHRNTEDNTTNNECLSGSC